MCASLQALTPLSELIITKWLAASKLDSFELHSIECARTTPGMKGSPPRLNMRCVWRLPPGQTVLEKDMATCKSAGWTRGVSLGSKRADAGMTAHNSPRHGSEGFAMAVMCDSLGILPQPLFCAVRASALCHRFAYAALFLSCAASFLASSLHAAIILPLSSPPPSPLLVIMHSRCQSKRQDESNGTIYTFILRVLTTLAG